MEIFINLNLLFQVVFYAKLLRNKKYICKLRLLLHGKRAISGDFKIWVTIKRFLALILSAILIYNL